MAKVIVIGSGFAGLSSSALLAKSGHQVTVLEKNSTIGGRARAFNKAGYTFDMGPSWYWMPDVFERFFSHFGKHPSDFYDLVRLDPSYKVFWDDSEPTYLPADFNALCNLFENYEPGAGARLVQFLDEAGYKYKVGMQDFVYKPCLSWLEFASIELLRKGIKLDLLSSMEKHIRKYFHSPKLVQLVSFPVLFLGAKPSNTPALYSMMNYADMKLGTWYPKGGMHEIIRAMQDVAKSEGVRFEVDTEVTGVEFSGKQITNLVTNSGKFGAEVVVNTGDYNHFDQTVLPPSFRNYSDEYWNKRTLAPSCLLYYLGVNKKIPGLEHHNLFFDASFETHTDEIYSVHNWPKKPLFYACCPSKTDSGVAPEGHENLFILIPVSAEISDTAEIREEYFNRVLNRMENHLKTAIRPFIDYRRDFARSDFISEYHSFKGNAYGLANTLNQTAVLKPSIRSKKINNLFYAGQLTVPGPGVPPSLISGEIAANLVNKHFKPTANEGQIRPGIAAVQ